MEATKLDLLERSDENKFNRLKNLAIKFQEKYGKSADFICRAPGRVNLIGEHIDYCGYSVLPMAVDQDVSMAVAVNKDGCICFSNVEKSFRDYQGTVFDYVIDSSNPEWHQYILCGLKGVTEYQKLEKPCGMDILVHGTVPKAAGMSSSSALVCTAGLATAYANECKIDAHGLADECAKCERYIGTQGGGMDQSISFLAERGMAKFISFNPLTAVNVQIPCGAVFVISNSCVKMQKAATAHFNVRVAECKIAARILAKHEGLSSPELKKFVDLQNAMGASFGEMLNLVDKVLHEQPYHREEICKLLEITDEKLIETLLSKNTKHVTTFKLYQRAKHVFSEAQRVHQFKAICEEGSDDEAMKKLGKLMNESHESCSKLYECSCPELDKLTALCRKAGALGSRLTGAGWAGCAVSLVPVNNMDSFMVLVKKGFYSDMDENTLQNVLFPTEPGSGAAVYSL
ncbi:N-acetylgalactosamine kinase-like isoform X1 [Clavelina lepadiformis]|uniref:N-acetylgalactosamine kinase-like isoform X1 n=2 Tax=Clavelina lepadiformis TaxID=159417 RepID=UPI004042F5D9